MFLAKFEKPFKQASKSEANLLHENSSGVVHIGPETKPKNNTNSFDKICKKEYSILV